MSGVKQGVKCTRCFFVLLLTALLTACVSQSPSPQVTSPQPAVAEPVAPSPVVDLLSQAERALADDRLMSPVNDNAYDRYQAVLLLQPDHPQALSGLQQILIRYLQLARGALARSQWQQADTFARRARRIDSDNPLLNEFEQQLQRQRAQIQAAKEGEYPLDPAAVSRRSETLQPILARIAERIRRSDESILIVARTDAEGRWIYKQMKAAAAGYRIRGDIKTGRQPKILVLAPINSL